MRMTVKTEQSLQDGGTPEYVYRDRTAWRCAVFVSKRYGSKGYPQRNAAHVRWTLPVTSNSPLKQHLTGERFPDDNAVERVVHAWFRQQPQEFYGAGFQGLVELCWQVFKFVWRLHWKIDAVCMSLSPLVSCQSRFVTYLLTYPRTWRYDRSDDSRCQQTDKRKVWHISNWLLSLFRFITRFELWQNSFYPP